MTALRAGSMFTGTGALDMAVAAVLGDDVDLRWVADPYGPARRVLAHNLPAVKNVGDVASVRWSDVDPIDLLAAGFPCQDVSLAGRRAGLHPDQSGLLFESPSMWWQTCRAIDELAPSIVVIENVGGLLSAPADAVGQPGRGSAFGAVLSDLADRGFDVEWSCATASAAGAPHRRRRVFIVAAHLARLGRRARADRPREGGPASEGGGPRREWDRADAGRGGDDAANAAGPGRSRGGPARGNVGAGAARRGPAEPRGCGDDAADPAGAGRGQPERLAGGPGGGGGTAGVGPAEPRRRGVADADPPGDRRDQGQPEPARVEGRQDAALGGGGAVPDPDGAGRQGPEPARRHDVPARGGGDTAPAAGGDLLRDVLADRLGRPGEGPTVPRDDGARRAAPDPDRDGLRAVQVRDDEPASPEGDDEHDRADAHGLPLDWGAYAGAIRRWEHILGRDAPAPSVLGNRGGRVLNPAFVEWMMGLPAGWVTAVPGINRKEMLRLLGNGVVPHQAAPALRHLLTSLLERPDAVVA